MSLLERTKERMTTDATADRIAQFHYGAECGVRVIFQCDDGSDGVAKLLEVDENTGQCGIMPLNFGAIPDKGIEYPSTIIVLTPHEFLQLKQHKLNLPDGWAIRREIVK